MPKVHVPLLMQRAVIQRAKGYCEYCQLPVAFSPASFKFEHIIPLVKQGLTTLENLAFSCGGCNAYKKVLNKLKMCQEMPIFVEFES